jgi:hypothetical protein
MPHPIVYLPRLHAIAKPTIPTGKKVIHRLQIALNYKWWLINQFIPPPEMMIS